MKHARTYREADVKTASPMQLILMLYDECLRSLDRAEAAFAVEGPERIEAVNNSLLHAQDIIAELTVSLDMEKGGEIAANLHNLYDFMIQHLSEANVRKEVHRVREVRRMMTELREAWQEVEAKGGAESAAPAAPPARSGIRITG